MEKTRISAVLIWSGRFKIHLFACTFCEKDGKFLEHMVIYSFGIIISSIISEFHFVFEKEVNFKYFDHVFEGTFANIYR